MPDLFDALKTAARSSDPVTSHEAAAASVKSGSRDSQLTAVLAAVKMFPSSTSAELARNAKLDRHMVARRLPELETLGYVERGDTRTCSASTRPGLKAMTWSFVKPIGVK